MKKIIVACGSGVATSQLIASTLQMLLQERGIKASIEAVDLKSLDLYLMTSDIYISIVNEKREYPIPVFQGIPFLTGIGQEEELEKIIQEIEK